MNYNPNIHKRRSVRLKGYDYSQAGLYFITICTHTIGIQMTDGTGKISGAQMHGYNGRNDENDVGVGFKPTQSTNAQSTNNIICNTRAGLKPAPTDGVTDNNSYNFMPLGKIENGKMILNEYGKIVQTVWNELPQHYANIRLGEFIIMPNHIHGIIEITHNNVDNNVGAGFKPAQSTNAQSTNNIICNVGVGFKPTQLTNAQPTNDIRTDIRAGLKPAPTTSALSEIVRALKTFSARKINKLRNSSGNKFWQRDYFEHIIRNENSHLYIIQYITNNPVYWKNDKFYTE